MYLAKHRDTKAPNQFFFLQKHFTDNVADTAIKWGFGGPSSHTGFISLSYSNHCLLSKHRTIVEFMLVYIGIWVGVKMLHTIQMYTNIFLRHSTLYRK